ncbi:hypothetical protein AMECASPLE_035413 [Ameca splendens]|uniref:Uncharacterized protein n=1 Tax=Ameca splendens TaxID=208324 RepID=A0ABV0YIJ6_9TELE
MTTFTLSATFSHYSPLLLYLLLFQLLTLCSLFFSPPTSYIWPGSAFSYGIIGQAAASLSLFFTIECSPGQCFFGFFLSLHCSLKPPVGRGRLPLTLSLVLLEVSSC